MYEYSENPNLPLRCPLCLSKGINYFNKDFRYECGCSNEECTSPRFYQQNGDSVYTPRMKWDKWVKGYKRRH